MLAVIPRQHRVQQAGSKIIPDLQLQQVEPEPLLDATHQQEISMEHLVQQQQPITASAYQRLHTSDGGVQSSGCARSQRRTFTAEDGCGNTSTASRTVTWIVDVTPPSILTGGSGLNLGCNPDAVEINTALGTATATDACGAPTITVSDDAVQSNGCARSQRRVWSAIDGCGNTSTASRTATWIHDVTPPTILTGGTGLNLGCNPDATDINGALGTATASDACGAPTLTVSDDAVQSNGCASSQRRICLLLMVVVIHPLHQEQ